MEAHAVAVENPFVSAREKFEELVNHLESRAAFAKTHDELESYLVSEGRELERRMLQGHLDLRATAERQVKVIGNDGVERRERRHSTRRLMSLVGEVTVPRCLYQASCVEGLCPQDASLNLPCESFSLGARRRVAEEAASGSFEHVMERVNATTGVEIAKRQTEELALRAAVDFGAFYNQLPQNDLADEAELLLVLTFDAAGIVMRKEDLRAATRRAAEKQATDPRWPPKKLRKGQKRNRKRMAQVAGVYAIEPHVRTPEDIVRELRPVEDTAPKNSRPKPVNKRVWASVDRDAEEVIEETFREAERRDPQHLRKWVVLVDGNEDQLRFVQIAAAQIGVQITIVLDLIHVLERLWKAAYCFHKDGTPEAEEWVTKRLLMLLEGVSPSDVAAGMTRSATLQKLERRKAVDECAAYFCSTASGCATARRSQKGCRSRPESSKGRAVILCGTAWTRPALVGR